MSSLMLKNATLAFCLALVSGCASTSVSRYDVFEKVQVDRMGGNEVGFSVFSRSVVCLNAMRETHWPQTQTNAVVSYVTNFTTSCVTNLSIIRSSNEHRTINTNASVIPVIQVNRETGETNVADGAPVDLGAAGQTVSTSVTDSLAGSPNQSLHSRTFQQVTLASTQATVNLGGQSLVLGTNQTVTVETNVIVSTITNQVISTVTNMVVTGSQEPAHDYYLITEVAPADFGVQSGESLVVVLEGARYGFSPSQPLSPPGNRAGFITTCYKVPAELVVGIANAREVLIRIKGGNGTLERRLTRSCRNNFRDFLLSRFGNVVETSRRGVCSES